MFLGKDNGGLRFSGRILRFGGFIAGVREMGLADRWWMILGLGMIFFGLFARVGAGEFEGLGIWPSLQRPSPKDFSRGSRLFWNHWLFEQALRFVEGFGDFGGTFDISWRLSPCRFKTRWYSDGYVVRVESSPWVFAPECYALDSQRWKIHLVGVSCSRIQPSDTTMDFAHMLQTWNGQRSENPFIGIIRMRFFTICCQ